jgi:zinc D-Ala-D-Ala dipeptidase
MAKWDRTQGRPEPIRALNRIPENENHEALVDMREYCPSIRIARNSVIPFARKSVAEMAERAAKRLPKGVRLGLADAWRPIERQQRIYDFMLKSAKEAYPHRDFKSLRRTVCRWVAPTDQKAPPGHCTGAALDVWLLDEQGEQIDVWSPYADRFHAAPTYILGLCEEALRNRMMLVETMLAEGFSNCRDEWWHYSYGDAGWAVRTGAPDCFYGLASLNKKHYAAQEKASFASMKHRTNPFLPAKK